MTIGATPIELSALIYVADEHRFFTDNDVKVLFKNYDTGVAAVEGLLRGEVDIALTTEFVIVGKSFQKQKVLDLVTINSEEALEEIHRGSPHLIFMDVHLPGMNSLQLTQKVKRDSPDIRIVILTDYDLPEYREAARQFGADRFFVKSSFKWDEVGALVKSISPGVP